MTEPTIQMPMATLRRVLDILGRVVNPREQTPLLRYVMLDTDDDGNITAMAASTAWSGRVPVGRLGSDGIDGAGSGRLGLPYSELASITEFPPGPTVTLTGARSVLHVASGTASWSFARPASLDSFPDNAGELDPEAKGYSIDPGPLAAALETVAYAMGDSTQWQVVEVVAGTVAAGDWHRAHAVTGNIGAPADLSIVLPGSIAPGLAKLLGAATGVHKDCWLMTTDRVIMVDLGPVGSFRAPAITTKVNSPTGMFLENLPEPSVTVAPEHLASAIRRSLIGSTAPRVTTLTQATEGGTLDVAGQCGTETIDAPNTGTLPAVRVDGDYLLAAARSNLTGDAVDLGADQRFLTVSDQEGSLAVIYQQADHEPA